MQHVAPWRSLSRKLPLFISVLLAVLIVVFIAVVYQQVSKALRAAALVRMNNAAQVVARTLEDSGRLLLTEMTRIGSDTALKSYVVADEAVRRGEAAPPLAATLARSPQTVGVELRDRAGKRLLWLDGPATNSVPSIRNWSADSVVRPRQSGVGPFMNERHAMVYPVSVPIVGIPHDTLGFLMMYRALPGKQASPLLSGLLGADAEILLGNRTDGLWNDLASPVPAPPKAANGKYSGSYTAQGTDRLGAAVPIRRTPWLLWVDVPLDGVLAPAHRFLGHVTLAAIVLVVIGWLGALLVSRQITEPLREVTRVAQTIATGDYSSRVTTDRKDELGVLATSFNTMAQQVDDSRQDMEGRVAERTRELQSALGQLHETQEALVRREKLAILGQLAGGVGHELRNPLGVMTNAIYYLTVMLKDAPENVKEYLGILRNQVGLSEKIVGDLLDFARVKQPQTEVVPVAKLVEDQLDRVGPLGGIAVERDFPPNLPAVRVDRVQMGQVILNLISNAVQAMSSGQGTLRFRAQVDGNGFVALSVIDTGVGMAPEQLAKIFDPLYTTKARGIGLGLSVSRGLAQANGGDIQAKSSPGEGAEMTISLPIAAETKAA